MVSSGSVWNQVDRGQGACVRALYLNCVCFGADGEAELQRGAADQKAETRRLQRGDGRGGPLGENPQMYCGESAVCLVLATRASMQRMLFSHPCVHD